MSSLLGVGQVGPSWTSPGSWMGQVRDLLVGQVDHPMVGRVGRVDHPMVGQVGRHLAHVGPC